LYQHENAAFYKTLAHCLYLVCKNTCFVKKMRVQHLTNITQWRICECIFFK